MAKTWSRSGNSESKYGFAYTSAYATGPTGQAPTYEQVAGLINDAVRAGGSMDNMPKDFEDYSEVIDFLDTTSHVFIDSLGSSGEKPTDWEFVWNHEVLRTTFVTLTAELPALSTQSGYLGSGTTFRYGATDANGTTAFSDVGLAYPVCAASSVFSTADLFKLFHGMTIMTTKAGGFEQLYVHDYSGTLYLFRGSQIAGLLKAPVDGSNNSDAGSLLPLTVTETHPKGTKFTLAPPLYNELETAGRSIRSGYSKRNNYLEMTAFTVAQGVIENWFERVNAPGHFKDPVAHSRDIRELEFYEYWNREALYGPKQRIERNDGTVVYRSSGICNEIKRYATATWTTDVNTLSDGYYPEEDATTDTANFVPYTCNGDSNFRVGVQGNPSQPAVFSASLLNDAIALLKDKLGNNAKNRAKIPNKVWCPAAFIRKISQTDKDRVTTEKIEDAMGGYYMTKYLTDSGIVVEFVEENELYNRFAIGNSANGKRRPLFSLLKYTPPAANLTKTDMFITVQGFQWTGPEYYWYLHENVTV